MPLPLHSPSRSYRPRALKVWLELTASMLVASLLCSVSDLYTAASAVVRDVPLVSMESILSLSRHVPLDTAKDLPVAGSCLGIPLRSF